MRNFWHTNRLNWRSCATPPLFPPKNEKILAHKLPKLEIVCHSSPIPTKKREIFGTQIAQIRNRVPLLTNLRRKMSNKRDRRRKGVIYPGQSGTGRSQNTFFTETGKEPWQVWMVSSMPRSGSLTCHWPLITRRQALVLDTSPQNHWLSSQNPQAWNH